MVSVVRNANVSDVALGGNGNVPFCIFCEIGRNCSFLSNFFN